MLLSRATCLNRRARAVPISLTLWVLMALLTSDKVSWKVEQSDSQSTWKLTCRKVDQLDSQSVGQLISWTVDQLDSRSVGQSISWTVDQLDSWSVGQSISWTVDQLDSWSVGQSISWTIDQLESRSVWKFDLSEISISWNRVPARKLQTFAKSEKNWRERFSGFSKRRDFYRGFFSWDAFSWIKIKMFFFLNKKQPNIKHIFQTSYDSMARRSLDVVFLVVSLQASGWLLVRLQEALAWRFAAWSRARPERSRFTKARCFYCFGQVENRSFSNLWALKACVPILTT